MEFALKEIRRIIRSVVEDVDWREKNYLKKELEKIIEKELGEPKED